MKRLLIAAMIMATAFNLPAKVMRGYNTASSGSIDAIIDSIDYRLDLTRVYARLQGAPHTSGRIDDITLLDATNSLILTDIDGVDLKRWFQWEDTPYIPIEIDFAPIAHPSENITFYIEGPRGGSKWIVSRQKQKTETIAKKRVK